MSKIIPSLWYADKVEEAVNLYVSVIPDSRIDSITTLNADSPSGPPGSVIVVEFTLAGQQFMAMQAGPLDPFNHAISFTIDCKTQEEIDRLWEKLGEGGQIEQCGWLRDRYGVAWQIVPTILGQYMKDKDRNKAARVAEAMLKMVKLDIAGLERAWRDEAA